VKECSKSIARRMRDPSFWRFYFCGDGIDIGGRPDPLALYQEFFPAMSSVRTWDREDGDARLMPGIADDSFDFVHSSHCLEHLADPQEALRNWIRILKPGGYLIVLVPDEDLYEQGIFPSSFNRDHRATFTIYKAKSWSSRSLNILDLLKGLGPCTRIEKVELLTGTYRFSLPRYDQTITPVGESAIEFIVRKVQPEAADTDARVSSGEQPLPELRVQYNQYRDDYARLRFGNAAEPPFRNRGEL
jgi:SAM-dependent methyltransferase